MKTKLSHVIRSSVLLHFPFLLLPFAFCLLPCTAQVPQGFNYQAIARDGATGNPITNQALPVRLTIQSDSLGGTIFWQEVHPSVTTNSFGLFTVIVGKGTRQPLSTLPAFSDIDWKVTPKFIKTEVNYAGWKNMGSSRLWSVPYSMVARDLSGSVKKLTVAGETTNMEEALFEVKNKNGQTVFAVYNEGVRAFVGDGDSKGVKGGFAIGSFDASKGEQNLFIVTDDSIRIYIDDEAKKAVKGGFAIGSFDASKAGKSTFFDVSPNTNDIILSENRILWYPVKNAFLTGRVKIEHPDSAGTNSFASGFESKAKGQYSQALGYQAIARGNSSTSIGYQSVAHKDNAFAFGQFAQARNTESYAFGRGAIAEGFRSYAFGSAGVDSAGQVTGVAYAKGDYSFAIGQGSRALGRGAFTLGLANSAEGDYSTAIGYSVKASGWGSTAMGDRTTASGPASTAMGSNTLAQGGGSTATGIYTTASGIASTAMGHRTNASGFYSTAMGINTIASGNSSTAMGNSTTASGNISTALGLRTKASGFYSTAMGYSTTAAGESSTAMGDQTTASGGRSTAMGLLTTASGTVSIAMGHGSTASGDNSTAMGTSTTASGVFSTSLGFNTIARGQASTAMGFLTSAPGFYSTAIGYGTIASGDNSTAMGISAIASGYSSTAMGLSTKASGFYSTAMGYYTKANTFGMVALGSYNDTTKYNGDNSFSGWFGNDPLFVIGNGTADNAMSNAITILKNGRIGLQSVIAPTYALELPNNSATGIGRALAYEWATYSDGRAKTERQAIPYGLNEVMQLNPQSYYHHSTENKRGIVDIKPDGAMDIGLIAQEVYDVIPEAVYRPASEENNLWSLSYDKLVPVLVKAIQEQQQQIESEQQKNIRLETELKSLRGQLEQIKAMLLNR